MRSLRSRRAGSKSRSPQHRLHPSRSQKICRLPHESARAAVLERTLMASLPARAGSHAAAQTGSIRRFAPMRPARSSRPLVRAASSLHGTQPRRADPIARLSASVHNAGRRGTPLPRPLRRSERSARCCARAAGLGSPAGNRFQSIARRIRTALLHWHPERVPAATQLRNRLRLVFASLLPVLQSSSSCHHIRANVAPVTLRSVRSN